MRGPARWGGGHGQDAAHAHAAHVHSAHGSAEADGAPGHHEGVAHDNKGHDTEPVSASDLEHAHHAHHLDPHESPLVMTIPLGVLAFGALFAGLIFSRFFLGHDAEHFWRDSLAPSQYKILEASHHVPFWVAWSPFVMLVGGFLLAFYMYIRQPGSAQRLAAEHPLLYRFLLNKWYFDEIYDAVFVRGAKWLGRFLWKRGDGTVIDGLGPDGISARVVDVDPRRREAADRLRLPLRFRHADRVAALISWYLVVGGGAH